MIRESAKTTKIIKEFEEALHDVEINVNNQTLPYTEDDIQLNVLTSNSMVLGRNLSP